MPVAGASEVAAGLVFDPPNPNIEADNAEDEVVLVSSQGLSDFSEDDIERTPICSS